MIEVTYWDEDSDSPTTSRLDYSYDISDQEVLIAIERHLNPEMPIDEVNNAHEPVKSAEVIRTWGPSQDQFGYPKSAAAQTLLVGTRIRLIVSQYYSVEGYAVVRDLGPA